MLKKIFLILLFLNFFVWAQTDDFDEDFDEDSEFYSEETNSEEGDEAAENASTTPVVHSYDEILSHKQFDKDQRDDEFANALRRRDWLKDRLILQLGLGSRAPVMGETGMGMGFGAGIEYITRWHIAPYATLGMVPSAIDNNFENITLQDGFGWKVGLNYYLFPKDAIHLGFSISYGTVHFDHDVRAIPENGMQRDIIMLEGYQFDLLITYLTNEWYYLQFAFGLYYAPNARDEKTSFRQSIGTEKNLISRVVNKDGIPETGLVFGIIIGFSFPEFFPDDTEIRRRARESERKKREGRAW
ncbi:MAG: hypothetical protein GX116_01595 [Fibrobacter sp.]|jgi:hypothetical protein|nr:hypothetical protein [Fibrobacter sp.]